MLPYTTLGGNVRSVRYPFLLLNVSYIYAQSGKYARQTTRPLGWVFGADVLQEPDGRTHNNEDVEAALGCGT